jgi:hypothetical protein
MICILALLVFSVLGIFSASHRELAFEAFECVTSRVKREPCETGLDDRIEASLVGKTLDYSPRLAKILKDYFEVFSWVLLILLVVSGLFAGLGVYNWAVHGNCNGPDSNERCGLNQLNNLSKRNASDMVDNSTDAALEKPQLPESEPCEGVKV